MRHKFVLVKRMKYYGIFLLFITFFAACQSGKKEKTEDGVNQQKADSLALILPLIQNDPVALKTLDSIPVPSLKDTANKDETGKDSLRFSRTFQLAANRMCKAEKDKDYFELSAFTPQSIIQFYKSREAYIERMKMSDEGRPAYEKILAGPIQRIAPATDDNGFAAAWYCLMPVRSYRKDAQGGDVVDVSWLGGQCDIKNQTVYFVNVTGLSREKILQVMPDLTFVLDKK
ncbi:MAG: hypothetical protein ACKO6I_06335 [Sphingomonadales bacterium]